MHPGLASLEAAVAAHVGEWHAPHVELAIHGTGDARAISRATDAFCRQELGAPMAETLFYRSSVGAVAGVVLTDGRRVVIKAYQPDRSPTHSSAVVVLQRHFAVRGLAPAVIAGPTKLGAGLATVEELRSDGVVRDGHDPVVRRALAERLHRVVHELMRFVDCVELRPIELPSDSLGPVPHSRLFDFAASTRGAAYIDEVAAFARRRMGPAGRRVISHRDWRAEHVRFSADAIVVAFDWDSLCVQLEPAAIGAAAHMFCAHRSREDVVQAPSLDEARAFVTDYEVARGRSFTSEERRLCGAWFASLVAYTARCGHASGVDLRGRPGNHQYLIAAHGERLLDL